MDVFNLFNFQTTTRVDESYTFESIYPVVGGKPSFVVPTDDGRLLVGADRRPGPVPSAHPVRKPTMACRSVVSSRPCAASCSSMLP